jgi:hypothetical protein
MTQTLQLVDLPLLEADRTVDQKAARLGLVIMRRPAIQAAPPETWTRLNVRGLLQVQPRPSTIVDARL